MANASSGSEPSVVNKLRFLRGPGESYSDVILEGRRGAPLASWTFQGIAYQTKRDYYAAIAHEWLSAGRPQQPPVRPRDVRRDLR